METIDGPNGGPSRKVVYDYDEYGNLEVARHLGFTYTGGDERTVWRRHHVPDDPGDSSEPWIMAPKFERIYSGPWSMEDLRLGAAAASRVANTNFYYDRSGTVDAIGASQQGELTGVHHGEYGGDYADAYYVYGDAGNKIQESVPTGESIEGRGSSDGVPAGVKKTTWAYGDAFLYTYPDKVINPKGQQTDLDWDPHKGVLLKQTDPNGRVVHLRYDEFARLEKTWDDGLGNSFNEPTASFFYAWNGATNNGLNRTEVRSFVSGANSLFQVTCFDGFGREIQSRNRYQLLVPTGAYQSVVETSYDERGLVAYTTEPFSDSDSPPCDPPGTAGNLKKTTYDYNPLGEVSTITYPGNPQDPPKKTISRDGNVTSSRDENGHLTKTITDGHGRLKTVEEWTGAASVALYATTTYGYDTIGNLTDVWDDDNNHTSIVYDDLGRKDSMTDPDMGAWTYSYDNAGNLVQQKDARGQYVSMLYDELNRVTKKCYTNFYGCPAATAAASFSYDAYDTGFCTGGSPVGQLTKMSDPSSIWGTAQWCHDKRGRVTLERRTIAGQTYNVSHTYDAGDNMTSIVYPDNENVTIGYNYENGQPMFLKNPNVYYVKDPATYDYAFRPSTLTLGNDAQTTFAYDQYRGRLLSADTMLNSNHVQFFSYDYDDAGNVTDIADWTGGEYQTACYDSLDRLTKVYKDGYPPIPNTTCSSDGEWTKYAYDEIGDLTHQGIFAYGGAPVSESYLQYASSHPHAVTSTHTSPYFDVNNRIRKYEYDDNGNLLGTKEGLAGLADADGDTVPDSEESNTDPNPSLPVFRTNQNAADTDLDGCSDAADLGGDELAGGRRDPKDFWDFFDTPDDSNYRDKGIAGGDFFRVLARFNSTGNPSGDPLSPPPPAPAYHTAFDRTGPVANGDSWDSGPPDGAISGTDFFQSLGQFNQSCVTVPTSFFRYKYDEENRLMYQANDGMMTRYVYDGQGTLVKKIQERPGQNPSATVYIGGIYEKNVTTGAVTKYYWFNGQRVAMRTPDGARHFLLSDQLGSTTTVMNMAGTSESTQKYYPFGGTRPASLGNPYTDKLYTGHQKEGSLYFMQARFYDPALGRFLQPDSIVPEPGNPQALNRYSYVGNNPLRYTDPTGHQAYPISCETLGDYGYQCPTDEDYCGMGITTDSCPGTPVTLQEVQAIDCNAADDWRYCEAEKDAYEFSISWQQAHGSDTSDCDWGCVVQVVYEFTPVADVCTILTWHTTCRLGGGRDTAWWEPGLSVAGLIPGAGLVENFGDAGKAANKAIDVKRPHAIDVKPNRMQPANWGKLDEPTRVNMVQEAVARGTVDPKSALPTSAGTIAYVDSTIDGIPVRIGIFQKPDGTIWVNSVRWNP